MIRAVIFDVGGVIIRTEDHTPRQQLAERLGLSVEELSEVIFFSESAQLTTLGQLTSQEHWEATRRTLGLSSEAFASVPDEFFGGDTVDYELVDYIRSLQPRYTTALLSNAWDSVRQFVEEKWKIADAFDEMIFSAEVGLAKPDPRIFQLTLERLGISPPEAVFVDDFLHNVEAANAVGLHAVHFRSLEQTHSEVEALLSR